MTSRTAPFELTDPTQVPTYGDGPLHRWCKDALYDARDEVFVRLSLRMIALMVPAMVALFVTLHWRLVPVWIVVPLYLAMWGWFSAPVILMLHNTMHRPFIRSPKWLKKVHPYALSILFGIPMGYTEHHVGMHHVEDNMQDDLSSTLRYRRDSFLNFLVYFLRFAALGLIEVTLYLVRKRRAAMARRLVIGDLCHQAVVVAMLLLDWRFGLVAFAIPYFMVRFLMMTGNWGQHAFINTAYRNDGLSNSITCINAGYNHRAFNDGYHIGHHLKANRHWTEMPQDFLDNRALYAQHGAIVFQGIDFFLVSVLLWTGQWNVLANRFVRLDGAPRSNEDVIALLKSRVHPIAEWPAESAALTS